MPAFLALPTLFSTLFGGLVSMLATAFSFFAAETVRKAAFRITIITLFISLTVGIVTTLINTITAAIPTETFQYFEFLSYFLPSNTILCLTMVIDAKILRWLYFRKVEILQMFNG